MIIAGVMSGSSLDGLDVSVIDFKPDSSWELLWTYEIGYSEKWVQKLRNYQQFSAIEYISFTADYSAYIGNMLVKIFKSYGKPIDYVSFHGHTLVHIPEKGITEQIGNGGIIAAITGLNTITDFRTQDVTKGGVGTPLAPLVEINLFSGHDYYLNLGGIANITKVMDQKNVIAYDVCPCNQVLNHFSNKLGFEYDKDGQNAREGSLHIELKTFLDSTPYISLPAPKSLDNNWIVNEFIPSFPNVNPKDALFTFCKWMAKCIADEVEMKSQKSSLMVSGGGAHNVYFMECLKEELLKKNCELIIPERKIVDFKEAMLMALMACKYLKGENNVYSRVTGASSDSIGGALYKV